jgi:hypothetical protein
MYLAAALCLWALRAWKIGQSEREQTMRKPSGMVFRLFKVRKV